MGAYTSKRWSWMSQPDVAEYGSEAEYEEEIAQRHFMCDRETFARLAARMRQWFPGKTVTAKDLRHGLSQAVDRAITRARTAASALRAHPRSATVKSLFQDAFAVSPDFVPEWRTAGAKWADLGELVAIRLEDVAKDLGDGSITFFCWDDLKTICQGADPEYDYRAATAGRDCKATSPSQMCLGKDFWVWWSNGDFDSMAAVLVHEALHDFFMCFVVHGSSTGGPDFTANTGGGPRRFRNANCYVLFMMRLAGKPLTACLRERCHDVEAHGCKRVS